MRPSLAVGLAALVAAAPVSAQDLDTRAGTPCASAGAYTADVPPPLHCWMDIRNASSRDGWGEVFNAGANTGLLSYSFFLADAGSGWNDLTYQSFLIGWDDVLKRPKGELLYRSSTIYGPTTAGFTEEAFDANVVLTPGEFYAAIIIGVGTPEGCMPAPVYCDGRWAKLGAVRDSPSSMYRFLIDAFHDPSGQYRDSDIENPFYIYNPGPTDRDDLAFTATFGAVESHDAAGAVTAAPEPGSMILMATGLLAAGLMRRRRRHGDRVAVPRIM